MERSYKVSAWAVVVRDEPSYPGDSMMEVIWDKEEAMRLYDKGYKVFALYTDETFGTVQNDRPVNQPRYVSEG